MASTQTRNGSTSSSASAQHRSLKNVAQKVVGAVKQHNKEVNAAFQAFYGIGSGPSSKNAWNPAASKAPVAAVQQ